MLEFYRRYLTGNTSRTAKEKTESNLGLAQSTANQNLRGKRARLNYWI